MELATLKKSLCWLCAKKEYDSRFSPNGQYYQSHQCLFPQHRHKFGRVKAASECEDFESEADVEARMGGGL